MSDKPKVPSAAELLSGDNPALSAMEEILRNISGCPRGEPLTDHIARVVRERDEARSRLTSETIRADAACETALHAVRDMRRFEGMARQRDRETEAARAEARAAKARVRELEAGIAHERSAPRDMIERNDAAPALLKIAHDNLQALLTGEPEGGEPGPCKVCGAIPGEANHPAVPEDNLPESWEFYCPNGCRPTAQWASRDGAIADWNAWSLDPDTGEGE